MAKELKKRSAAALAKMDYGEDVGGGFENQTAEDRALPWLTLLQDLSPQIKKKEHKIEGAEIGMFCNTLSKELYPAEGIEVVFAATEHVFCEWKPKMGGFVGRRACNDPEVLHAKNTQTFGEWKTEAKNDLIETFYVYGVIPHNDGREPEAFIMSFTGTKIKAYKVFMQRVNMVQVGEPGSKCRPPLFAHRVILSSYDDTKSGNDFKNVKLKGVANDDLEQGLLEMEDVRYQAARALSKIVVAGDAKVDYEAQREGARSEDDGDGDGVF